MIYYLNTIVSNVKKYLVLFKEAFSEVRLLQFPTKPEVIAYLTYIFFLTSILSVVFFCMDTISLNFIKMIFSLFV